MSALGQIRSVTLIGLKSLPERLGTSMVIVIGVAAVVLVLVSAMAVANGFAAAADKTGTPTRAIVVNGENEARGNITRDQVVAILNAPGIRKDAANQPIASAEVISFVGLTDPRTGLNSYVTVRGVGSEVFALRPEIKITQGRAFRRGARELLVGRGVLARLGTLAVGSHVPMQGGDWVVSGIFASNGDTRESEVIGDADLLLGALRRTVFNSVTVALADRQEFASFRAAIESDPRLGFKAFREDEYFARLSRPISSLLKAVARLIGGLMAFGAIFAALNTMYTVVRTRAAEISTLRAIGFGAGAVATSVVVEALLLALAGSVMGALLAWCVFDGATVSAMTGVSPSQLTFPLQVGAPLLLLGIGIAALIAVVGGSLAAARATRIPVAVALRMV